MNHYPDTLQGRPYCALDNWQTWLRIRLLYGHTLERIEWLFMITAWDNGWTRLAIAQELCNHHGIPLRKRTEADLQRLANEIRNIKDAFCVTLLDFLGEDLLADINGWNAQMRAAGEYTTCATHEYCDPNDLMATCFEVVTGQELDLQDQSHLERMNLAWDWARAEGFDVKRATPDFSRYYNRTNPLQRLAPREMANGLILGDILKP